MDRKFGYPSSLTADCGRQLESGLFSALTKIIGSMSLRTAAHHAEANSIVERLHQQFKPSLSAANNAHYTEFLRNALKSDAGCNTAELVYDTLLRLPGEFVFVVNERSSLVLR
ncbi:unnamed protein product [Trichobilharzia regenti]|nr:unnamed protein product [Trichobilharzia regenti]